MNPLPPVSFNLLKISLILDDDSCANVAIFYQKRKHTKDHYTDEMSVANKGLA